MNTSEPLLGLLQARQRVLEIQTKLHRWANDDPDRRFDDLFDLVTDPSFVDGVGAGGRQQGRTLGRSRRQDRRLRSGTHRGGRFPRRAAGSVAGLQFPSAAGQGTDDPQTGVAQAASLGIPTVADRVVQASLKLVLEPRTPHRNCGAAAPAAAARRPASARSTTRLTVLCVVPHNSTAPTVDCLRRSRCLALASRRGRVCRVKRCDARLGR